MKWFGMEWIDSKKTFDMVLNSWLKKMYRDVWGCRKYAKSVR